MIKKILLVSFLIFIGLMIYTKIQPGKSPDNNKRINSINQPALTPAANQTYEISYNNQKIAIGIIAIENSRSLNLISNFKEKLSTSQMMERNNCRAGVNGGFYGKDDNPLGLFNSESKIYGKSIESRLFNGYFYKDSENQMRISYDEPQTNSIWALQSGPMLVWEEQKLPLKINSDENALRMAVVQTLDDEIIFIAFYDKESRFEGPLLADLPAVIQESEPVLGIKIRNALNLDGGR